MEINIFIMHGEKFNKSLHIDIFNYDFSKINSNYNINKFFIRHDKFNFSIDWKPSIFIIDNIGICFLEKDFITKIKNLFSQTYFIYICKNEDEKNQINILNTGIDYYLNFSDYLFEILLCNIKNILFKMFLFEQHNKLILNSGNLKMDFMRRKIWKDNEFIHLTKYEFDLLYYLIINENILLSKNEIFNNVWGYVGSDDITNIVSQHIFRLRKKIKFNSIIHFYGQGYLYKSK